jgi:ribosomal protein S18 acetylase RimI-like enzyme
MIEAERRLQLLGHREVALPVDVHNPEAARLYIRLGYRDWGLGAVQCPLMPDNGAVDYCVVLVKKLAG